MKISPLFAALTLAALGSLSGCQQEQAQLTNNDASQAKPVKLYKAEKANTDQTYYFPAKIEAYRQVNLAFEVSGKVTKLNLPEGKRFKKGQLLAALNEETFARRLKQSQVNLKDAKTELKRLQAVDRKGLISKQNVTKAQTAYESALIAVENAEMELGYSKLYAPFDGVVSKRMAEVNNYLPIGTTLAELQDLSKIYFAVDVSEKLVSKMRDHDIISATATLNQQQTTKFKVTYAEHEATTNPITQTYRVYFSMPYPENSTISLGSHASLAIRLAHENDIPPFLIPLNAVVRNTDNTPFVWIYEAGTQTARKNYVSLGRIHNDQIEIKKGLIEGEQIIVAGASKIRENQKLIPFNGER